VERDCQRAVVERRDRLDEARHRRQQFVASAGHCPIVSNVGWSDRTSIGEAGFVSQRDHPCAAVVGEPPGGGQAGNDAPFAVDADERLVDLPEQQSLPVRGRAGRIRRIDAVANRDRCDRCARFSDQGAVADICS
jgi:hypothetical protein